MIVLLLSSTGARFTEINESAPPPTIDVMQRLPHLHYEQEHVPPIYLRRIFHRVDEWTYVEREPVRSLEGQI